MPLFTKSELARISSSIFSAFGVPKGQADMVGESLAKANLLGHDSHGVIRVPQYMSWLEAGDVQPEARIDIAKDTGTVVLIRGNFGFGQVIGRWAMDIAIAKAKKSGFVLMGLNQSGHLGRIGEFPEIAVQEGLLSLHFVNTHGGGRIVAPYGGAERRMSANPVAAGVPIPGRVPMIMDISTSAIAGGKVHVAHNQGKTVPEGCLLDQTGKLTVDPTDFVAGKGALVHFAGHKGFSIGLLCDILAGAFCEASCSDPKIDRVGNAMFSVVLDPGLLREKDGFHQEVSRYLDYLKASPLREGFKEILYPGEPEARTAERRAKEGISVDDTTWSKIVAVASKYKVDV